MLQPKKNFNEIFSGILSTKLKSFSGQPISRSTSLEIYQVAFNLLADLLTECEIQIRNDAINYIAQLYYDCISINGSDELDENIFTKRVTVQDLKTEELSFIIELLHTEPVLVGDCLRELRRRS